MKMIAIDEATARLPDALTETSSQRRSRTAVVRTALRLYAERVRRQAREAKDGAVFCKHRKRLARQARAMIAEQARL